jgi:hypothetical protein
MRFPRRAIAGVCLVGVLCGCSEPAPTTRVDRPPATVEKKTEAPGLFLTVSQSTEDLEAAMKLAKPPAVQDPLSVANLDNTWGVSIDAVPPGIPRDQAIAKLQAVADDQSAPPHARAVAACMMALIDQKRGESLILSLLRGEDKKLKGMVLLVLSSADADALRIADPGLVAELKTLMSDPDHGEETVRLYASRRLPDTAATLWELLPKSEGRRAGEILFWLVRLQPDRQTLDACVQALSGTNVQTRYRCMWGMEEFFEHPDAALARDASECAAREMIRQLSSHSGKHLDYPQSVYAAVLQSGTGPQARKLAEMVFVALETADPYLYACAYAAIRKGEGEQGRRQLIRDLADSRQFQRAIKAVDAIYKGTGDAGISDALVTRASREQEPAKLVSIAETLLSIGGAQSVDRAKALAARLPYDLRLRVLRAAGKEAPRALAMRLTAAGILDSARVEVAVSNALAWHRDYYGEAAAPVLDAQEFLSADGVVLTFDVETDEIPVRHDKLILNMAKMSDGEFQPRFCHETGVGNPGEGNDDASYLIQFVHGERLYRFIARDFVDWYDVERVVLSCNRALADANSTRRFMALAGDGQCASIICATAAQAKVLAEQFHLSFDSNLSAAMQDGKSFETEAIERLKDRVRR